MALVLASAVLVGAKSTPTELDVTKLTVRDANGKVGRSGIYKAVSLLRLYDANGTTRAALAALTAGLALVLADAKGKMRAKLEREIK